MHFSYITCKVAYETGCFGFSLIGSANYRQSDPSGSTKTDRYLVSLDNDRDLLAATGKFQHLIEFLTV